jgi:hypothetical protein
MRGKIMYPILETERFILRPEFGVLDKLPEQANFVSFWETVC